jgi:hypothetical protein
MATVTRIPEFGGELILPGNETYDRNRAVLNGSSTGARPPFSAAPHLTKWLQLSVSRVMRLTLASQAWLEGSSHAAFWVPRAKGPQSGPCNLRS